MKKITISLVLVVSVRLLGMIGFGGFGVRGKLTLHDEDYMLRVGIAKDCSLVRVSHTVPFHKAEIRPRERYKAVLHAAITNYRGVNKWDSCYVRMIYLMN